MKKILALMLALAMCLSLCACGGNSSTESTTAPTAEPTTEPIVTESPLTEAQMLVIDAVNAKINSEEFASWENLYMEFTSTKVTLAPQVTNVTHYEIEDFDGAKMDCYLVTVAANIAHWVNEEAEQGAIDGQLFIFVDANTATSFDSITTDASNVQHDTTTEQGRATYLMWLYGETQTGSFSGPYLNNSESVTEMSEAEVDAINDALVKE